MKKLIPLILTICMLSSTIVKSQTSVTEPPSATGETYNSWTYPTSAYSEVSYAYAYVSYNEYPSSQDYYNFNFSIPTGATIEGIEIISTIMCNDATTTSLYVELSSDGGTTYTSSGNYMTTTTTYIKEELTTGGFTDTWGRSWTDTDFSNTNFRLKATFNSSGNAYSSRCYFIEVTVYYTESGGSSSGLSDGIISYWSLDETSGSTAVDAAGSNDGTVSGPTIGQSGVLTNAYSFDGSGDIIDFGQISETDIGSVDWSFSCWFKTNASLSSSDNIYTLFANSTGAHAYPGIWIALRGSYYNGIIIRFYDGSNTNDVYPDASLLTTINNGAWHNLVVTIERDGDLRMYLDNTDVGGISMSSYTGDISHYGTTRLGLYSQAYSFNGYMDEVGIWNRSLSSSEISDLYNSGAGISYSDITGSTTTVPDAPSGLSATVASCSQINLSWTDNSDDETGFNIYRDGTQIATADANATSYNDSGLDESTPYEYDVKAANSAGESSGSGIVSATTDACTTVPEAPSGLTATAASCSQINLSWTDNADNETGFYIFRDDDQIDEVSANTTTYSNTELNELTTYEYYVVAHNAVGNSSNSNIDDATTSECIITGSSVWTTNGDNVYYNSGKVSIGTDVANSGSALTVNGKILALEVEVVSSISSDFVFESGYNLMSLPEVEIFIKKNKHLPGIPSASEFAKSGQNLAKTDDLLLRKIEELTLYTIAQQKEIEELKKEIELLKKSSK